MADRPLCVLLPGFDGSGRLFAPLLAEVSLPFEPRVETLPSDVPQSYDELAKWLTHRLPTDRPFALLAESFSGPLAVRIASQRPKFLSHLVLVATFLRSPLRRWLAAFAPLARSSLFSRPPPTLAIRALLAGWDAPPPVLAAVREATMSLPPAVAAARARAALSADVVGAFASLTVPTLWIRASADCLLRSGHADDALASRPSVRVVSIDGPHMILQRRPNECLAALARFLATPESDR